MPRLVLLLLALALLGGAQLARADGAANVTIAPSGGGAPRSLALADLAAGFDVHGIAYTVRAADGSESTTTVGDGISLNALLAAAGLEADAFDYIALEKADGSSAIVMRDDLGGTDEGPPVVWADADGTHFLRPSSGEGDANGADLVTLADGAPLALALKRGEPLVPRIAVSTLRARPRERIDFGASLVGGGQLGPNLDYEWYFDGTGTVRGANVSHRFARPGTYLVLLNVVRGRTTIGNPDTVSIRVVRPHRRRPDDARRSGESPAPVSATPTPPSPPAPPASAPPTSGSPAAAPGTTAAPPSAPPAPAQHPHRRPPGELVSGTLLASASAAAAPREPARSGARATSAAAASAGAAADGPLHVPVGVWVAIGLAALLALGWALESRHTLPFWQP